MKVLTIGTATRDVFVSSKLFRVVHDPAHLRKLGFPTGEAQCFALGGKVEVNDLVLSVGGDAANAAMTFARQGFKTSTLIKVGGDQNGQEVFDSLVREGIRPLFKPRKGSKMDSSIILLSPSGERTILVYRGISKSFKESDLMATKFNFDVAYIAPGRIPLLLIKEATAKLKKGKCFVAMNPSKYYLEMGVNKLRPILKNLDSIILNREEGSYLTGVKYEDEKGIFKKFDQLVGGLAVMTDGPKGVMVSDGRNIYRAGIFKDRGVVDRTGAGDAFGSGFVAGLVMGSEIRHQKSWSSDRIQNAIKLGSANATSVVEAIGAQAGILTRARFSKERRWRGLGVEVSNI